MLSGKIKGGMSAKDIAKVMQTPVDNVTKTNIIASAEGDELYSVDDDFDRDFSYNELVAKGNINGKVIQKNQQIRFTADGSIDIDWVVNQAKSKCKTLQTKTTQSTYYIDIKRLLLY